MTLPGSEKATPKVFQIGETVWIARVKHEERRVTCPDCLGAKFLTVRFADGVEVTIDCKICAPGFEAPRGWTNEYVSRIESVIRKVEGIQMDFRGKVEYRFFDHWSSDGSDVFATKEEADERAKVMMAEDEQKQLRRATWMKEDSRRSWAWNASYHRQRLKAAQREIDYHTRKLAAAKEHKRSDAKEALNNGKEG